MSILWQTVVLIQTSWALIESDVNTLLLLTSADYRRVTFLLIGRAENRVFTLMPKMPATWQEQATAERTQEKMKLDLELEAAQEEITEPPSTSSHV